MQNLFSSYFHEEKIKQYQPPLSRLDKVIKWDIFKETIEQALYKEPKGLGGRPAFCNLLIKLALCLKA